MINTDKFDMLLKTAASKNCNFEEKTEIENYAVVLDHFLKLMDKGGFFMWREGTTKQDMGLTVKALRFVGDPISLKIVTFLPTVYLIPYDRNTRIIISTYNRQYDKIKSDLHSVIMARFATL